jgi:hypothetical protein
LIEILVALAVLSVGVTIFISLFSSSLALSQSSRNQTVAASLAEEQIQFLLHHPAQYDWHLETAKPGELIEVTIPGATEKHHPCDPPGVLPVEPSASMREQNLYDAFTWQAFRQAPSADAAYMEVTVVVRWVEAGRPRLFALTSAVPRSLITGAARAEGST